MGGVLIGKHCYVTFYKRQTQSVFIVVINFEQIVFKMVFAFRC